MDGLDSPAETYKGVTYQHQSTDVCANDDKGAAAAEASRIGVQLSKNNDEEKVGMVCATLIIIVRTYRLLSKHTKITCSMILVMLVSDMIW